MALSFGYGRMPRKKTTPLRTLSHRWGSHFRPAQPILALTHDERVWRKLTLLWGVAPLRIPPVTSTDEMTTQVLIAARQSHLVRQGDRVVLTAGVPVGVPGNTNMIQVLTIER
jgi:pyruvate kinase (EC 2.7.1.40)